MGTSTLAPMTPNPNALTLSELQGRPECGCNLRFGRYFYSPMMVSELTRPMTPLNFVQFVDPLLTIDLLVGGMTAAAPVRPSKQTFNMFFVNCADVSSTEFELTPQNVISRPWIASAVKELNDFQQWLPNWNEAGAAAFAAETLDTAREVLQKLWDFSVGHDIDSKPNIAPLEDGSVRFEWTNRDKELFLTVLGRSIEAQRWHPLKSVESETYHVISPLAIEKELEWFAA